MSLKSELAALLIASLQDVRCAAPRLFIDGCYKRSTFGGGIPEYRLIDKLTDTEVTDNASFITHIKEENLTIRVNNGSAPDNFKDKCKPVMMTLNNVIVTLHKDCVEDSFYSQYNASTELKFCFVMGYVGDNDGVLPMKLLDCFLVKAVK